MCGYEHGGHEHGGRVGEYEQPNGIECAPRVVAEGALRRDPTGHTGLETVVGPACTATAARGASEEPVSIQPLLARPTSTDVWPDLVISLPSTPMGPAPVDIFSRPDRTPPLPPRAAGGSGADATKTPRALRAARLAGLSAPCSAQTNHMTDRKSASCAHSPKGGKPATARSPLEKRRRRAVSPADDEPMHRLEDTEFALGTGADSMVSTMSTILGLPEVSQEEPPLAISTDVDVWPDLFVASTGADSMVSTMSAILGLPEVSRLPKSPNRQ